MGCLGVGGGIAGHGGAMGVMAYVDSVGCWVGGILVGLGTAVGCALWGGGLWGGVVGW